MKDLESVDDSVLLAARNTFMVIKEMLNASELPTGDAETSLTEIEDELDRIDLEILGRGLLSMEELQ
tara:strand:+ start:455 stop:655 length:201 start_codon:yes stop_codon:yes gene_type:complete